MPDPGNPPAEIAGFAIIGLVFLQFLRGSHGSKAITTTDWRAVRVSAARSPEPEASADPAGRPDPVGAHRCVGGGSVQVPYRAARHVPTSDCGAAVSAARLRSVRRGSGGNLGREPVLAGLHRGDLSADQAAD